MLTPPIAKKQPHIFNEHGDNRQDDYYWLRDIENPAVKTYLDSENAYYREVMRPLANLTDTLYAGMLARIPESDHDAPLQSGDYFYYTREDKDQQYPIYVRKHASKRLALATAPEEIILDVNELAVADEFLDVVELRVSNSQHYLAYLVNHDGSDSYICNIKDLTTCELLADEMQNVYSSASLEWSADDNYLFYVTHNEQQRPDKLWRHKLGTPSSEDVLLLEETDPTFSLTINRSNSGKYIFITAFSTETTEVQILSADQPLEPPQLFQPRRTGIQYLLEHWQDKFLALTNENATNFKLLAYPLNDFNSATEVVPYDDSIYLEQMHPFREQLYVSGRANGLTQLWLVKDNQIEQVGWDDEVYTVYPKPRQSYDAPEFVVSYQSLLTPDTIYAINLSTGCKAILQQQKVAGDYDSTQYRQEHLLATAADGTDIPILLVYREGALADGPAPLILTGYGAYGISSDPLFDAQILPVLDQGVIYAIAQIRGGSENGRSWYYSGRQQQKLNTFTDFIACAQYLIDNGYTSSDRLAGYGGSAGGLLIGVVANMAGPQFKALVAEVPFVDAVTTMLDDTIPLTTSEYDEWGNPANEADYRNILSYSPYDNVAAMAYPALYVTTGLNDPRVGYWEPAKWVAKLRDLKTDDNTIALKINMGAGHAGNSGRLENIREWAQLYAFVLHELGVAGPSPT